MSSIAFTGDSELFPSTVAPTLRSKTQSANTASLSVDPTAVPGSSSAPEPPSSPLTPTPSETEIVPTVPPPSTTSDSDSSSDSDFNAYNTAYTNKNRAYTNSRMPSDNATVEHPVTKHCPILTAGEIHPKVLVDLSDAHHEYFIAKDIADADKVKKILGGFKDVHIRDWISCERDRLIALSYKDFMAEIRSNYLPADWEEKVRTQILGMRMSKDVKFWDWAQEMRALNIVLRNTDSHLSETALRNQLEAALEPNLRSYCFREKLNKKTDLKDWVLAVKDADEKLKDNRKRSREIFNEESSRAAKRPAMSSNSRAGNTAKSSTSGTFKRLPKLEPDEKDLLEKYNGCFKCRCFDQSHGSRKCTNDFPDAETYVKITAKRDAAGNAPKARSNSSSAASSSKVKTVAAIAPADDVAESSSEDENNYVSSVMPNAALGNGSSSEDDVSAQPLRSKHYIAKFKLFAKHLDFGLVFSALVDNGAHVVLIRPEVVDKLQLERFALNRPETVSVAISHGKEKKKMSLTHYVKFTVTSVDNAWTSKVVRAIIAPGLCMPIILGLPFLEYNDIVADHGNRSCIDKKTGYNILNPGEILPPPPPKLKLREKAKFLRDVKKLALAELMLACKQRIREKKLYFEKVKDVDIVASIRGAIEVIALKEKLEKKGSKIKADFREIFEPIPHVNRLPTDYVARISLKDAEKRIANRVYSCPRKYKEAFKTLIQQHLDAGRIRHSSSSYALPCFIIPKADPSDVMAWLGLETMALAWLFMALA
ncbi:hypothetical protein BJ912DRAFT_1056333 [Pholiota molesta]|nr:hypothetical protein BJ912DRAFT_1056333 [Pholiota molesta]